MKKISAILAISLTIVGCYKPPNFEQIKSNFFSNRNSFEKLHAMILEDAGARSRSFAVGTDHIGDYWEFNGKWSHSDHYENKMSLDEVLNDVGITKARYDQYLALFKIIGAERITYWSKPGITEILIYRSGICVSGSSTTININNDGSIPSSDIQKSYSTEITPIIDGWYISHDCT
jgi:hypothetical protein